MHVKFSAGNRGCASRSAKERRRSALARPVTKTVNPGQRLSGPGFRRRSWTHSPNPDRSISPGRRHCGRLCWKAAARFLLRRGPIVVRSLHLVFAVDTASMTGAVARAWPPTWVRVGGRSASGPLSWTGARDRGQDGKVVITGTHVEREERRTLGGDRRVAWRQLSAGSDL